MSFINDILQHPVLISHLSGADNYTWVHFRTNSKILISKPLRYFEDRFPHFIRLHKIVMANPNCIKQVIPPPSLKKSGSVQLEDGTILPISRRRWKEIAETIWTTTQAHDPSDSLSVIVFVTADRAKGLLLQSSVESIHCPYRVHVEHQYRHVYDFFAELPTAELPALTILDARDSYQEPLTVLQQLKTNRHTAFLPTIVLIKDDTVENVYLRFAQYANSVVTVSDHNTSFVETISWLCEYWLRFNVLPTALLHEDHC